jgi:LysR family hydrogen peroxide-inducible transcriptional activator
VLRFCDRRNLHPQISFRSAQLETVQSLVRAGLGLSLVPEMAVQDGRRHAPEYRSLARPAPRRQILAFWPKQRPPSRAAAEFLQAFASDKK